jgi:arsenate reductase
LTDEQLLDFMLQHPILINRPFVVTELGTRLSRPSELVLEILPLHKRVLSLKKMVNKCLMQMGSD